LEYEDESVVEGTVEVIWRMRRKRGSNQLNKKQERRNKKKRR
jgi:hypothetical protein